MTSRGYITTFGLLLVASAWADPITPDPSTIRPPTVAEMKAANLDTARRYATALESVVGGAGGEALKRLGEALGMVEQMKAIDEEIANLDQKAADLEDQADDVAGTGGGAPTDGGGQPGGGSPSGGPSGGSPSAGLKPAQLPQMEGFPKIGDMNAPEEKFDFSNMGYKGSPGLSRGTEFTNPQLSIPNWAQTQQMTAGNPALQGGETAPALTGATSSPSPIGANAPAQNAATQAATPAANPTMGGAPGVAPNSSPGATDGGVMNSVGNVAYEDEIPRPKVLASADGGGSTAPENPAAAPNDTTGADNESPVQAQKSYGFVDPLKGKTGEVVPAGRNVVESFVGWLGENCSTLKSTVGVCMGPLAGAAAAAMPAAQRAVASMSLEAEEPKEAQIDRIAAPVEAASSSYWPAAGLLDALRPK